MFHFGLNFDISYKPSVLHIWLMIIENIAPHFKEIGRKLAYIGGGWDKEWGTETTARLKSLNIELWVDAEIKQESSIKGPYEP